MGQAGGGSCLWQGEQPEVLWGLSISAFVCVVKVWHCSLGQRRAESKNTLGRQDGEA